MCSEKFLKNSIKLLASSFPVMKDTFSTRRTLKGKVGTPRAILGYMSTQGTEALEHLRHWST